MAGPSTVDIERRRPEDVLANASVDECFGQFSCDALAEFAPRIRLRPTPRLFNQRPSDALSDQVADARLQQGVAEVTTVDKCFITRFDACGDREFDPFSGSVIGRVLARFAGGVLLTQPVFRLVLTAMESSASIQYVI